MSARARPDDDQASVRDRVIGRIADQLIAIDRGHPTRVAVDGITAAGKTTLAAEITAAVAVRGRRAIHLSMDGYHHPRAHRHRLGRDSAIGYYRDAYDLESFADNVLSPLGPDGDRRYRQQIIDLATDEPVADDLAEAATDAVVVVDGTFLQRAELTAGWDEVVFVDASAEVALRRGVARDTELFGTADAAHRAFASRYHAAFGIYVDECAPAEHASIVIGNDDLGAPVLRRIGGPAAAEVPVFSYGTLQLPAVQVATFGRELAATPDSLPAHRTEWVTITDPAVIATSGTDRHPLVVPSEHRGDAVSGTVLLLTTSELAAADMYEVDAYRRVLVQLASGTPAWVYLSSQ